MMAMHGSETISIAQVLMVSVVIIIDQERLVRVGLMLG